MVVVPMGQGTGALLAGVCTSETRVKMEHNKAMTDLAAHLKTGTTASNDHGELFVRHSRCMSAPENKNIFMKLFFPFTLPLG